MTGGLGKSERHDLGNEEQKSLDEPSDEAIYEDDNDDYQMELDDYEAHTEQSKPVNKNRVRKTNKQKIHSKRIKSKPGSTIAPKLHNLLNLASNMFAHHHK